VIAFVGPHGGGKTVCAARLAAAYARAGILPVRCISLRPRDDGALLRALLIADGVEVEVVQHAREAATIVEEAGEQALVVVDTPGVSARAEAAVRELGRDLRRMGVGEPHVVIPATMSGAAARESVVALRPLKPTALVLSHVDETSHIGPALGLAVTQALPLSYVSRDSAAPGGLEAADARTLASLVLP
jgi:flagellar biosynthesis protein FlhF